MCPGLKMKHSSSQDGPQQKGPCRLWKMCQVSNRTLARETHGDRWLPVAVSWKLPGGSLGPSRQDASHLSLSAQWGAGQSQWGPSAIPFLLFLNHTLHLSSKKTQTLCNALVSCRGFSSDRKQVMWLWTFPRMQKKNHYPFDQHLSPSLGSTVSYLNPGPDAFQGQNLLEREHLPCAMRGPQLDLGEPTSTSISTCLQQITPMSSTHRIN